MIFLLIPSPPFDFALANTLEVCTLIKLILVMPATNAASERSFSAMRRVKSYLRTTMTQGRLNHLMLLHVHNDRTKSLEEAAVACRFVAGSEHRRLGLTQRG